MKSFASDNYSGVAPEIFMALATANVGHATAYGGDEYTLRATELVREIFNKDIKVLFVSTGTAANTLAIKLATKSYHSIICADCSHMYNLEVGAPIASTGCKVVTIETKQGKIIPEKLEKKLQDEVHFGSHNNKPRILSITQPTEFGTIYTIEELDIIADICKAYNLYLHMDGCRLYNAAIAMNEGLKSICEHVHVDVLSLGGTKNGLMFGEMVVIFNKTLQEDAEYYLKQLLQLDSKMRFLTAQFIPFFEQNLWKKYATHANTLCNELAVKLKEVSGIKIIYPVETNQIFVEMPTVIVPLLQAAYPFNVMSTNETNKTSIVRLMTTFDTKQEEVDDFIKLAHEYTSY